VILEILQKLVHVHLAYPRIGLTLELRGGKCASIFPSLLQRLVSPQSRISKAMLSALLRSSILSGESDPIKFVRTDLGRLTSSSQ